MKDFDNTVNNVNKIGGGKSDSLISLRARIKRLTEHGCAWLAAFFVSAPALMSIFLVLTSCSEDERVATPTATTSTRITDSTDVATDTGQSFYGEISDWEEEKGEVMPTGGSEKGGDL